MTLPVLLWRVRPVPIRNTVLNILNVWVWACNVFYELILWMLTRQPSVPFLGRLYKLNNVEPHRRKWVTVSHLERQFPFHCFLSSMRWRKTSNRQCPFQAMVSRNHKLNPLDLGVKMSQNSGCSGKVTGRPIRSFCWQLPLLAKPQEALACVSWRVVYIVALKSEVPKCWKGPLMQLP